MTRLLVPAALLVGLLALPTRGDDLPVEAAKRVKKFDDEVAAARDTLVKDLVALKADYEKAGKADDAKVVADRIALLTRDAERSANLLVNGSFEDGPAPEASGVITLGADSTDMKGWKVTVGSIDHIGPYWKASHGTRSLDLNGSEPGAVAQTFPTKNGQKYRLSFALAMNTGATAELVKLKATAAGSSEEFAFAKKEATSANMNWVIKTWEFTAVADETTLEFISLHGDDPFAGPALDDVIVAEVKK
jgi:choice-of-anchor C domain-containing protein